MLDLRVILGGLYEECVGAPKRLYLFSAYLNYIKELADVDDFPVEG